MTDSMRRAIDETYRRRAKQQAYNEAHGITPVGIRKAIRDIAERVRAVAAAREELKAHAGRRRSAADELHRIIRDLETQMREAARALEFERAALLRDQIVELRRTLATDEPERDRAHASSRAPVATRRSWVAGGRLSSAGTSNNARIPQNACPNPLCLCQTRSRSAARASTT